LQKFKTFIITESLISFNKKLEKKHPGLALTKGKGYFYLYAKETASENVKHMVDLMKTTMIPVNSFGQQSEDVWMKDVEELINSVEE